MVQFWAVTTQGKFFTAFTLLGRRWLRNFFSSQSTFVLWVNLKPYKRRQQISYTTQIEFFRNLSHYLKVGTPIVSALTCIGQNTKHDQMRIIIFELIYRLQNLGQKLSEAFHAYSDFFSPTIGHHMFIAEQTGQLDIALERIVNNLEENKHIHKELLKGRHYLLLVLFFVSLSIASLFVLVIPIIRDLYTNDICSLPLSTRSIFVISDSLLHFSVVHCLSPIIVLLLFKFFRRHIRSLVNLQYFGVLKSLKYKLPFVRSYYQYLFWNYLSLFLLASVPLVQGLTYLSEENIFDRNSIKNVIASLHQGKTFSDSLKRSPWVTPQIFNLITLAESTGNLVKTSSLISQMIHDNLKRKIELLLQWLQPLGLLLIASLIIWVITAVFGPLYNLRSSL